MTDVDVALEDAVSTYAPQLDGAQKDALLAALQKVMDAEVEEETRIISSDLTRRTESLVRMTTSLTREIKARELEEKVHAETIGRYRWHLDVLTRGMESRNPLVRLVTRAAAKGTWSDPFSIKNRTANEIVAETLRQDAKWGISREYLNGTGPDYGFTDEVTDYMRKATESAFRDGEGSWQHVLTKEFYEAMAETNPRLLRKELIRVAAVCLTWVVALKMQRKRRN